MLTVCRPDALVATIEIGTYAHMWFDVYFFTVIWYYILLILIK